MRLLAKGMPFMHVEAEGEVDAPVFSEEFLYQAVGRDDARFILGVAEEYTALIDLLGEEIVNGLLTSRFGGTAKGVLRDTLLATIRKEGVPV